ncbi:MAG: hypothetical protein Q9180_001729 [Flavoplaca navasiana]
MPPTSNSPVTAKKRQSCDRCHGQKLRCIRVGSNEADACNRCLRQGAHCLYSHSLPKGRPNMYRTPDAAVPPSNPPPPAPVSPELHRHQQPLQFTASADVNVSIDTNGVSANAQATLSEDPMVGGQIDTSTSTSTSTWPWLEPFNWNDMDIDGNEQDSNHWTSNANTTVDPHSDAGTAFLDAFPSLMGWASAGNADGDGGPPSPIRLHEHGHGLGSDLFESTCTTTMMSEKSGPDLGIARLSQLSTRLYPLHQSSCNLADAAGSSNQSGDQGHARRYRLIDDAAFKSVAGWLVHVSANLDSTGRYDDRDFPSEKPRASDTLHDAFSASHHLLETLRCLQAGSVLARPPSTLAESKSTSNSTGGTRLNAWGTFTPPLSRETSREEDSSYCKERKGSSSYARPSDQYSNNVVRHLVMACHTLLLNIYVAVLIALQHDADRSSSGDSDAFVDSAALADIRRVLAVQLCSYLIDRQHQAVDSYLSPPSLQHQDPSGSQQSSSPESTTAHRELMADLRMEIQQRLGRLRQSLRI